MIFKTKANNQWTKWVKEKLKKLLNYGGENN